MARSDTNTVDDIPAESEKAAATPPARSRPSFQEVIDIIATANGNDARARIENADLKEYSFAGKRVTATDFVNCDLGGVSFRDANLQGSTFPDCELGGADFEGADLRWSSLWIAPR